MNRLEPLKFRPELREKIWGTKDPAPIFERQERRIGEAWCVHNGSTVASGPLEGRTVRSLVQEFGARLMGPSWSAAVKPPHANLAYQDMPRSEFPVLAKLLFADDQLSVQTHPDNDMAQAAGHERGKTELWYVVASRPGGRLGLGLLEPLDTEQLVRAAESGAVADQLRWVPAVPGECVLVPAGTVHCAGNGVVLCEVQQNSDITYRLHDYGRPGLDGKPRELQIKSAVAATKPYVRPVPALPQEITSSPCLVERLGRCSSFVAELLSWEHPFVYSPDPRRCQLLACVRGAGTLNGMPFSAGDAFLIPAESSRFHVDGGEVQAVRAYLP